MQAATDRVCGFAALQYIALALVTERVAEMLPNHDGIVEVVMFDD